MQNQTAAVQIYRLNDYPPDKYNVLVPVTTMQAASNLQRLTVSEVKLDTRQDQTNKGPSKDIYYEKSSGKFAITKVGGMKLAAAANVSIVSTETLRTDGCGRCIEMARATGKARVCGNCEHVHDLAVRVVIRVPEPSGGFRMMTATKEIDCTVERRSMSEQQYSRFLQHRAAMAESKAFMRAIRAALGLSGGYTIQEIGKPFIVARVTPNLDAPEIRDAIAANYLQSMGLLFENKAASSPAQIAAPAAAPAPADAPALPAAKPAEVVEPYPDEPETTGGEWGGDIPDDDLPWDDPEMTGGPQCADCGATIVESTSPNGRKWSVQAIIDYSVKAYGRQLCPACQRRVRGGARQ